MDSSCSSNNNNNNNGINSGDGEQQSRQYRHDKVDVVVALMKLCRQLSYFVFLIVDEEDGARVGQVFGLFKLILKEELRELETVRVVDKVLFVLNDLTAVNKSKPIYTITAAFEFTHLVYRFCSLILNLEEIAKRIDDGDDDDSVAFDLGKWKEKLEWIEKVIQSRQNDLDRMKMVKRVMWSKSRPKSKSKTDGGIFR